MLWESFRGEWDNGANLQSCLNRLESAKAKAHMRDQWLKWQDICAERTRAAIERRKQRASGGDGK